MLKKFKSIEEKLLFEMQCYFFGVMGDMIAFNHVDFYWIRLEKVSFDIDIRELSNAFGFVGFKGDEFAICLDSARTNMLGADPPMRQASMENRYFKRMERPFYSRVGKQI